MSNGGTLGPQLPIQIAPAARPFRGQAEPDGPDAEAAGSGTKSAGPTPTGRERRGPTQRVPEPDAESAGPRRRERGIPAQRVLGPDAESAGPDAKSAGTPPTRRKERRGLTLRPVGPDCLRVASHDFSSRSSRGETFFDLYERLGEKGREPWWDRAELGVSGRDT